MNEISSSKFIILVKWTVIDCIIHVLYVVLNEFGNRTYECVD